VRYPNEDVITANEIHIPIGEPVEFQLTSVGVTHSFWVPELYGKVDMMPGTTTSVIFTADEHGRYRGQCAQLCGIQHANMALSIVADEPEEFSAWMSDQRRDAEPPAEGSVIARGEEIFLSSSCMYCHTVRGSSSPAQSDFGPDLTHLASRETIAAGILEYTPGNLAAWIIDPQHLKPGNAMPAANLSGEELQALLACLNSLD
jgi:cytochrome c oxidase subunit II